MRTGWMAMGGAVAALILAAGAARAADTPALLAPGATVVVPDFEDSGTFLGSETLAFGGDGPGPIGTLTEYVFTGEQFNPFGPDGVAFAFSVSLTEGDTARVVLPGYAGFLTAVKSCNDEGCIEGIGDGPDLASRSADGDAVTFTFSTPLTGASSGMVIYTNAHGFSDPPTAQIFDSAGDVSFVSVLVPSGVPEPAAWTLMILGLAGAGGLLRRQRARMA